MGLPEIPNNNGEVKVRQTIESFRVFSEMKSIGLSKYSKNMHLLPHRYTRKVPIYGTSPHVLFMHSVRVKK